MSDLSCRLCVCVCVYVCVFFGQPVLWDWLKVVEHCVVLLYLLTYLHIPFFLFLSVHVALGTYLTWGKGGFLEGKDYRLIC
ncbi:hypothetical protein GGS20DRAFT_571955 [Poronia punctata]|nr:hypothetical protein GGS20DRAFT_571955 [Poronia punctata]